MLVFILTRVATYIHPNQSDPSPPKSPFCILYKEDESHVVSLSLSLSQPKPSLSLSSLSASSYPRTLFSLHCKNSTMWFPSSSTLGGGPQSLVVALTFFSFPLFFQSAVLALPEIRSDLQLKSSDFKLNPAITLLNPPPPSDPLLLLPIKDLLPPDNLFKITDAVKTKGISLAIKIPVDLFVTPRLSFKDRSQTVLQQSLPQILQQFNVPADQIQARVDQGIPLLINGIQELLSDDPSAHSPLVRRNILDTIGGWAKDAGCALVAAGGLPLFLLAAADFTASNTDGKYEPFSRHSPFQIYKILD